MTLLVLLLIFPTLDSHSTSFVSTALPNDFSNLTVNLPTLATHSNSFVSTDWPNKITSLTVNLPHS